VIVRLYHADKTVRQDLAQAVASRNGFVLATQMQGPRNANVAGRPPFKEIVDCCGNSLDLIVVIDEGKPEGMWRDPFGELCERLFREKREAAAATSGWVLIRAGQAMAFFRKALWDPLVDAEEITTYLNRAAPTLFNVYVRPPPKGTEPPPPPKAAKPKAKKTPVINPAAPPPPGFSQAAKTTTEMPLPSVVVGPELSVEKPEPPIRHDTDPGVDGPQALGGEDEDEVTMEAESPFAGQPPPPAAPPAPPTADPWFVLGIHKGAAFDEVKKAYRALVTQYHPDKVAHLAPEFKRLAEDRTRELNIAYTMLEKELGVKNSD
jgi:hypothetical protein